MLCTAYIQPVNKHIAFTFPICKYNTFASVGKTGLQARISNVPRITETIVRECPKIGRNKRVSIKNIMTGENKTLKYKVAEPLIEKGEWVLIEGNNS